MDRYSVVLKGSRYPIYLIGEEGRVPSGYHQVATDTPEAANAQIAEIGPTLVSDPSERLNVIQLLQAVGIDCPRDAKGAATARVLKSAFTKGLITCYHQNVRHTLSASDDSNTQSKKKKGPEKVVGKKATQASVNSTGAVANNTSSETPITEQECRSDPVSMLTGEEILPLVDFTLAGSRPLVWRRLYRSSHSNQQTALGNGWRHDFMVRLTEHYLPPPKVGPKQKGTYWLEYHDEHGASHRFEKVKPGQSSYQLSSKLALHYQTNGKQVLVTPKDEHLTFKAGESAWLLEKIINETGQSTRFYYDAKERLARIEVNKARGCLLNYNAQGWLVDVKAYHVNEKEQFVTSKTPLAHYNYDETGNLIAATNQQGETERYTYNAANLITKRTRASGFSHHFEWDSYAHDAKCIKQWGDNDTYCYQFEYGPEKGTTTSIDSRGNRECFVHNEQGKLTEHTDPNGNIRRYVYNQNGQKIREIDPQGNTTDLTYTPYGQLESVTTPDGNKTTFAYNQLGQRILTVLPDKTTIARQYNVSGLLLSETQPDGRSALYSYDNQGHLSQHIAVDGQVTKFRWNEQGELLAKQENDSLTRYSYDNLGRINATLSDCGLLVQYKRNERGQLIETVAFDENAPDDKQHTYFDYDEAGRLIASKNNKGEITRQTFEGLSQPSAIIQPDGSALHLTYDQERNLTGIRRDDDAHYRIAYDANENPIQITGFDGKQQRYQYDGNNRLISLKESDKRIVNIQRDVMGRVIAQQASAQQGRSESHQQIVNNTNRYQYDVNGNLVRAHNPEVTLKQTFDRGNRLLSSQQTQGAQQHTLHYQYDEFGRRKRLTLPDGKTLHYRYNQHSQLTAIELSEGDSSQTLAVFQYDKQNRLIQQTFGNHIALEQTFDVFHRLTQQNLTHPEQRLYDQCAYQYDGIDQLIGRQSQTQTSQQEEGSFAQAKQEAFEYNTLGQLIKESVAYTQGHPSHSSQRKHTEFEWDSVGNPIAQRTVIENDKAKSHPNEKEESKGDLSTAESEESVVAFAENDPSIQAVTEGDRLLKFADIDFDYDDCGNQISELGVGVKTQRSFNAFNQLTRFAKDGVLTQYDYDPLGRRIAKHTEQGKIDFIWDGNQLLGECLNGQYTWYINRPNEFHPVALIKQGEVYYYHLDQLNTPRFVTNQAAEVVWQNTANAYGYEDGAQQAREIENTNFYQPIRFQGQYFDQESGFHYNRYRYYCPKQQRFIHQDPIGIVGGINHYQYAPNPVNWVDPMGLMCKEGQAKVAAALDANSAIPEELKEKIIALTKLDDSGYTADEMIGHINNNTVDEMLKSAEITPSVLKKENLLGKGAFKEAYIIDNDTVFLTPIKQVHHNKPHSMDDLRQEAFLLDYLEKQHDLPVLKIYGERTFKHIDGSDVKGLVAERKLFNGKDVQRIRKGNNPQGLTMDDVKNSITSSTLKELEKMNQIIEKDRVVIKDLQIMYGQDGYPVIADPLDAYAGKYADEKDIIKNRVPLTQNIEMVKAILKEKNQL
ncbi:Putative deoxyribonuclease RhsC [Marinomonas spartinae]|uniref:RHS repeat-associated core domain-containing protein n=1 Tax=Marinomonas spartinae TaxID=1792290 RepID=UPI000808A2EF|nr:RHS repeat-associated core domain-containing protein [Marinomonas spartinae]SBS38243.1 Putative deoxyribonuclease RhsC [Marinomonas spartinae]